MTDTNLCDCTDRSACGRGLPAYMCRVKRQIPMDTAEAKKYRDALERIAYREPCHDAEAEELRLIARRTLGLET